MREGRMKDIHCYNESERQLPKRSKIFEHHWSLVLKGQAHCIRRRDALGGLKLSNGALRTLITNCGPSSLNERAVTARATAALQAQSSGEGAC